MIMDPVTGAAVVTSAAIVTTTEVTAAARLISSHVRRTRLVPVPRRSLWVKPECDQPTGSFKVRGAVNAVARIATADRSAHVVAQSSGNHGQALAYAAGLFGLEATVVVPNTVPAVKLEAIRRRGARAVVVPPADRELAALDLAAQHGSVLVRSDDPDVIAGHATVGLEITDDLDDVDVVLVPVCNGGLIAGVAAAIKARSRRVAVIGVRRGTLVRWSTKQTYRTIADGLRAPMLGRHAWHHIQRHVDGIVTVSEEAIREAMAVLFNETGLLAEPSGAVATAAHLQQPDGLPTGRTVAVLSGGNIEASIHRAVIARPSCARIGMTS
jgi:threonine dehydratase